jgi:F-type H+-transporting ATPase subunit c
MDIAVAKAFAAAIITIAIALVGVVEGITATKAVEVVGRNPESVGKVRTTLIIGIALTETEAIYSLVVAILVIFVL